MAHRKRQQGLFNYVRPAGYPGRKLLDLTLGLVDSGEIFEAKRNPPWCPGNLSQSAILLETKK